MGYSFRHLFALVALIALATPQRGYGVESGASIFGETTARGIRDWFAVPRNRRLFDGDRRVNPERLSFSTKSDLDWSCRNHVSPDGRFVFCIQKTGSGDNSASLFRRGVNDEVTPVGSWTSTKEFSDEAWGFFRKRTGLAAVVYHRGVDFVAWGDDRQCVEFSLHGTDCYEGYYISGWILHYNITTRRFFVARGQKEQNKKAIVSKKRRPLAGGGVRLHPGTSRPPIPAVYPPGNALGKLAGQPRLIDTRSRGIAF